MKPDTSLVDEYIAITAQIKELTDRRRALLAGAVEGRHTGSYRDVYITTSRNRTVSKRLLRRYISDELISRCCTVRATRSVVVKDKLKPKQPKTKQAKRIKDQSK